MSSSPSYQVTKSVLTIQSHVVHGYVGNRTSTFPLQVSGWDADVLNTVQLSNHTGYGKIYGQKLASDEIWTQYEGLVNIGMDKEYDSILTGYVPNAQGTQTVGKIAMDIVEKRRKAIEEFEKTNNNKSDKGDEKNEKPRNVSWILDPVIGDNGRFYVDEDVIPVYRDILKSGCVDTITPNQFEAEILSEIEIKTKADVFRVLEKFHKFYKIKHVVITSLKLDEKEGKILSVGSTVDLKNVEEEGAIELNPFYYEYPSLDAYITGTGDLFAAILIDRLHKYVSLEEKGELAVVDSNSNNKNTDSLTGRQMGAFETKSSKDLALSYALGEVLGVVQAVIKRTLENPKLVGAAASGGFYGNIESMKNAELRLVQSVDLFPKTDIPYQAHKFCE